MSCPRIGFALTAVRDALNPAAFFSEEDAPRLRAYRVVCALAVVLIPCFGLVYGIASPGLRDPLWARLGVGAAWGALGVASFWWERVRTHMRRLMRILLYVTTAWIIGLAWTNGFHPDMALGLLFTLIGVMVSFSMGLDRPAPLGRFLAFSVGGSLVALALTPPRPQVNPFVFGLCITGAALVFYMTSRLRLAMRKRLLGTERRFRTLMGAANDAIIVVDAETGRLVDANDRAEQLTGYVFDELQGMHHSMLQPAEERAEYAALFFKEKIHEKPYLGDDLSLVTQAGEQVPVDLSASVAEVDGGPLVLAIFRDVTDRKRHERQLVEARERAEEMLRLKTDILNNMSHELRTPLTSILGFSETLTEDLDGELQEFAEIIHTSTRRLRKTLNSVLNMAQLEHGDPTLDPAPMTLADEVEEALSVLRPLAEEKGLTLRTHLPAAGAQARLDEAAFHRILHNLVSNAVKFTEEGSVTLTVEADASEVHLRVSDTGVGISDDFLPHLFEQFRQQSRGLGRDFEGSGLGLAITKRLVDLQNGTIEVESEEGEGTTFTVSFPRRRVEEGPPGPEETADGDGEARLPEVA
jgi:PAS domain S-box-containing protein